MKILMVGDVVGKPGRAAVIRLVPGLREVHSADFVVVNAENAAGGMGITPETGAAMLGNGLADVLTLGNHAWAKREAYGYLSEEPRILRPANYPPGAPGRGHGIFQTAQGQVVVMNLQGRVFMESTDDPFRMADALLAEVRNVTPVVFIDFHAEATSEKQAFGWYVDGRASAVIGTHTHVQTADERILPGGTAYLTDVGMTGPIDSIIGMRREIVLPRFTTLMPARFEVAEGPARLCGAVIDIDATTGRATHITRIQEGVEG
jgi:metallophosphoesterase (TIGR00282 family)